MANEIDIDIGSFNLDSNSDIAIADINVKVAKTIREIDLPKSHGSIIPIGTRKSVTVSLRGSIIGTNYDDLRTNLDALKAALEVSAEQKLTLDDDRYLMVQYKGFSYSYVALRTFATFSFDMVASDPFWYLETLTETETTPTTTVGFTVNNPGNAPTRVKITITNNGGSPVANDIQVENSTTGEKFQYRGSLAAGKALVVNNRMGQQDYAVENDGVDDIANFEGDFITLNPGNNTLILTTAGASVALKRSYRAAYL